MTSCEPAWAFAQAFYERPGVSDMLIALQDDHGVDIPLLLVALHAARLGQALDPIVIRHLVEQSGAWRNSIVAPIRLARRTLKDCPLDPDGALYDQAIALEIGAEKAIILELATLLPAGPPVAMAVAAFSNLEGYRRLLDLAQDLFAPALAAFGRYEAEKTQ